MTSNYIYYFSNCLIGQLLFLWKVLTNKLVIYIISVKLSCQKDYESLQYVKVSRQRRFNVQLKNNLKMYRAREDINQQEMGKKVGVSRQTISAIERGDYSPSVTLALEIANFFEVAVEEIFYLVEEN